MKKNEFILLIVTIIIIALLGIGFYRDQNVKVIKRTVGLEMTDGMEIVSMEKRGFLLFRSSYTAKIKIDYETDPDVFLSALTDTYNTPGQIMSYKEYQEFKIKVLGNENIIPEPIEGTNLFLLGAADAHDNEVVYIIDTEGDNEAYVYIYFYR